MINRMRIAAIAAIGVATLAGGCAATPEQLAQQSADDKSQLASALEGRTPGKPQDCISAARFDGPQIVGGDTLIFRDGAKLYRTTVESCPSLRGDPIVVTEIYGSQICRHDKFRTLERSAPSIPSGYCYFSDFTPYSRPKR